MFAYIQTSTLGVVRITTEGTEQIQVLQKASATRQHTDTLRGDTAQAAHVTQKRDSPQLAQCHLA